MKSIFRLNTALSDGLALAILGFGVVAGAPAFAQNNAVPQGEASSAAADSTTSDAPAADVVVTGSRIQRPDLASSSPVASIDAETLKSTNTVTVEQLLQSNPQFIAGAGGASNNPGDGEATVDLRGLGVNRTLVLIDGKRAPVYNTRGSVDLNTIPTALIKRVDVLTGGASSVYGSDAIAGVVNFILDDRFTGIRFDGSSQVTGQGDAPTYDASLTVGTKLGDRGNLVVSGGYSKRDGLFYAARPRNANAVSSKDLTTSAGSSNSNPTVFDVGTSQYQITPSGVLSSDIGLYNFSPVNYAQLPLERYNVMALGRYELTDNIELYGRGSYAKIKVNTQLAPTATAGFGFNIDPANPFLTDSERAVFFGPGSKINDGSGVADDPTSRAGTSRVGIRRRIVETGGRLENHNTDNYQFVGGVRGDFGGLNFDVFAQYGWTDRQDILKNDLSYNALQQALDVVSGPNGPACFNPSNGCVPLNVFQVGVLTPQQLAFVVRDANQQTKITQFVAGGNLSGDLGFLQSPWASRPAAFSVGVEYRRETGSTTVDPLYASGDLIYYGQGQNIVGKYDVKEIFGEIKVPIVQDKPFFNSLNLEGGYRYSDYSTVGGVSSYKGGADWSPIEGVRFRGVYQRAVRAPNLYELYSPVVAATGSLNSDPCSGTITTAVATICRAQGAPASAFTTNGSMVTSTIPQPVSGQINIFSGGNPKLKAEQTDTYTLGVVVNPAQLRGLTLSVDYYSIQINNAVDTLPPSVATAQCYNGGSATSAACTSIVRNPDSGSLSGDTTIGVPSTLSNIAVIKTRGIDATISYRGGSRDGFHYAASFAGTYIASYQRQASPGAVFIQCAGVFSGDCNLEPIAKWKHVGDLNLGFGGINLLTRWRFFGAVRATDPSFRVQRIPGYTYIDETISFNVNDKFSFRVGVTNLFDRQSPIVGDTTGVDYGAGSTFPNTYDVIGRRFFAGVSAKF